MFRSGSFNSGSINPESIRFIGVVTEQVTPVYGGFIPQGYKLKKKDEEILEQVYSLVAKLEEIPEAPKELKTEVTQVKQKAQIYIRDDTKELQTLQAITNRLEEKLNTLIKLKQQDEDNAIIALLNIL